MKKLTAVIKILFCISMLFLCEATAYACTGVYVGRKVSQDGSTMIARTEDIVSANNKMFIVHEAKDHTEGEMFEDSCGFSMPYPKHTYRYTAVSDSPEKGIGDAPYGEAGFNEFGLAATSTITAYPNEKALAADPFTENGLCEISANDIILSQAKNAREAIELLASIIDTYGSGEGNIIMVADQEEAWYMEILSGHQYAAIKMPEDMAAVIPNNYMLETINLSSKDVIVSKDLVSLARDNNFLVEQNGTINIKKTYSIEMKDSSIFRVWGGQKFLSPTTAKGTPLEDTYSLFFKPDHKITLEEVFEVQKYRYEDTEYNVNLDKNSEIRAIGISRQQECHVLQIRHNMPSEFAGVEWLCMGNCEFSVFMPFYASILTDTADIYKETELDYNDNSAYWAFRGLSTLCAIDRERYGSDVRKYWQDYQKLLIKKVEKMDDRLLYLKTEYPEDLSDAANAYGKMLAEDAFAKAKMLRNGLMTFIAGFEGKVEAGDDIEGLKYTPSEKPEIVIPLFSDIDTSMWYCKYIDYCVDKKYMDGVEHGKFSPETNMTKGQYLAILYRLFYGNDKNWIEAGNYISDLLGLGWSIEERGTDILRSEVADICCKLLDKNGKSLPMVNQPKMFADIGDVAPEAAEAILYLQQAGILDGYGNGIFGSFNTLKRSEMTAIIYNLSKSM